jgi:outer membrane protein OmpA-like peptidoglycan-associated protein
VRSHAANIMEALHLSTERARAARTLASVLLLSLCVSAPAGAHERAAVDSRSMAQAAADEQKRQLEEMRDVNVDARRNAQRLQRQIRGLQAEVIDRGLLLTLEDGLFAGNSARLNTDGGKRLDKLAGFLDDYPHRSARIESSAACKASAGYDAALSERRAAAVASSLLQRGVASARLSAGSSNELSSVDDDCDAHELHRNRQVIVIIENVLRTAEQP